MSARRAGGGPERVDPPPRRSTDVVHPRLCDACGLPGRARTGTTDAPSSSSSLLVRCSRCRAGWYHDEECQRIHHPLHRLTCRRHASASTPAAAAVVRVVQRPPPTGNALVMTTRPDSSSALQEEEGGKKGGLLLGVFRSLVPPVVTSAGRRSRCAWCLSRLPAPPQPGGDSDGVGRRTRRLLYRVPDLVEAWACGPECEKAVMGTAAPSSSSSADPLSSVAVAAAALLRLERDAILGLHGARRDPPTYLPTALLLFRLLVATCLTAPTGPHRGGTIGRVDWDARVACLAERPHLSELHHEGDDDDVDDDDEWAHEEAVVRTVQGLRHALILHQSSTAVNTASPFAHDPDLVDPAKLASRQSTDNLRQLLRRIKANAFGIRSCDEAPSSCNNDASAATCDIGVGIFHVAHFANHSCRPNAEAVYRIKTGRLPRLALRLLLPADDRSPPAPHDEVTVSYVSDEVLGLPRRDRRRTIYRQFGFRCDCSKCRSGN